MFHRHFQNIRFLQLGLLLRDEKPFRYSAFAVYSWSADETREDNTHIQPERSDHGFFELIQTVVYPLPSFPLNERLSEL